MKRWKLLFALITEDNDTEIEQAAQARLTARDLGLDLEVVYAEGDSVKQSQQLLEAVQSKDHRPDGIIFDPVFGNRFPHAARAATAAGIAWAVIDLRPPYLSLLRKDPSAVAFGIGCDQVEVGRIQGRQVGSILRSGGNVLVIQGPSDNLTAKERTEGFEQAKPSSINARYLKGKWTEESGYQAVKSYLALSTAHARDIQGMVGQSDMMAMGARQAFEEVADACERQRWLELPVLGADGLPKTGQAWVKSKRLTSTVIVPLTASLAIQMMVDALTTKKRPPEYYQTTPQSFPALGLLKGAATP